MKTDELKRRLGQILAEEEGPDVDWDAVAAMSAQLAADLGHSLPPIAADYLASVERRREDSVFGHAQRSVLVLYLGPGPRLPRKSVRVGLTAEVTLRRVGKSNYRVRVFDASPDGCKLEFIERPDLGEFLWVKFEGIELLQARVCWTEGFTAGVEFQKPIHPAVFESLVTKLASRRP
jgi:hypothetical protein